MVPRRADELSIGPAYSLRMTRLPLFPPKAPHPAQRPPDTAYIRKGLNRLLRLAREAQIMPWNEGEARSWEKLFPALAASLPAEEAEALTSEFRRELARLRSAPQRQACRVFGFDSPRPTRSAAARRGAGA